MKLRIRSSRSVVLALTIAMLMTACAPVFTTATFEHAQADPDTRPWFCDSTGGGGHGGHTSHHYDGIVKGELDWNDCLYNAVSFDRAVDYVQQWPTAGDAEADGFMRVVPYAEGMGTHHRRVDASNIDDVFDPGEPEFLMYDGNGSNAELTGMAWWVESVGAPPEGFRGDNDWWHQHLNVCLTQSGTWIGQGYTPQQCAAVGGEHFPNDNWWMAHAWILPDWELHFDVFQNHHPCLPWSGPITDPGDPCWMEAMHGGGHGG
ncbi:MAG: hypothetical protein HKN26_15285 [Acidimicrobiales bacterium]|nr:hypothetical protein [Acidimicrobiales bacterium]